MQRATPPLLFLRKRNKGKKNIEKWLPSMASKRRCRKHFYISHKPTLHQSLQRAKYKVNKDIMITYFLCLVPFSPSPRGNGWEDLLDRRVLQNTKTLACSALRHWETLSPSLSLCVQGVTQTDILFFFLVIVPTVIINEEKLLV